MFKTEYMQFFFIRVGLDIIGLIYTKVKFIPFEINAQYIIISIQIIRPKIKISFFSLSKPLPFF